MNRQCPMHVLHTDHLACTAHPDLSCGIFPTCGNNALPPLQTSSEAHHQLPTPKRWLHSPCRPSFAGLSTAARGWKSVLAGCVSGLALSFDGARAAWMISTLVQTTRVGVDLRRTRRVQTAFVVCTLARVTSTSAWHHVQVHE